MNILNVEELRLLLTNPAPPCVSILMPTQKMGQEVRQNPVRFKNLLKHAEQLLVEGGMRAATARDLLADAKLLLNETLFWERQGNGFAAFISHDGMRHYRLPFTPQEASVVTGNFHIKPLLPFFTDDTRFYILALSLNEVRLLQCTRDGWRLVEMPGVPKSLQEAVKYDEFQKQIQYHTRQPAIAGRRGVVAFGQGVDTDDTRHKTDVAGLFTMINDGIHKALATEHAPLITSGVDYLRALYRETNNYANLMDQGLTGSPEHSTSETLWKQAWPLVEPQVAARHTADWAKYRSLESTPRVNMDVAQIVPAAVNGHVELLFAATNKHVWGRYDRDNNRVELHDQEQPGDDDLLDVAAVNTLLHHGRVYATDSTRMPTPTQAAAVLRY